MVTTLDGKFWETQELLEKMLDDEFYYNYLGKVALSSSSCTKLLDSPRKYELSLRGYTEMTEALKMGSLIHYKILEPHKFNEMVFIDVKGKNSKVFKMAVEQHGVRNTYTVHDRFMAEELADVFLNNSRCLDMLHHSRTEVPAIGEIDGLPFRAKSDILGDGYIVDLKTTSSDLKSWKYSADKWNYDMQTYIYCTLFDIPYDCFTFVVLDKMSKGLGIFECSKDFYLRGKFKTEQAIQIYRDYFIDKKKEPSEFYLYDVL